MRKIDKINEVLEIPREVISKIPKITILGFDEILIENFISILEYEEFFVQIKTHIGIISINGFNFSLSQITEDEILIKGKIESLDFENRRGE